MKKKIKNYLQNVSNNFKLLESQSDNIQIATNIMIEALNSKNKIVYCGNGGSAADSQHLSAELMGRYKLDRKPLPAISLTVDTSAITAIGNDYGFEHIFSRQLEGIGNKGDILYATSTSGESKNVIKAIEKAKEIGIKVICVTCKDNNKMSEISNITIHAQSNETNHIQEMHIAIGQLICGIIEEELFGKNN